MTSERPIYGDVSLEVLGDNNQVTVDQRVYKIGADLLVRSNVEEIVRPVKGPKISEFQIRKGDEIIRTVTKEEVVSFQASYTEDGVEIEEGEDLKWVSVRKHWNTPEDRKWQFYDGVNTIDAAITDPVFWERMHRDEIVPTEHALFHIRIRWRQELTLGLKKQQEVVEVVDYRPPDLQTELHREPVKA